MCAPPSSPASYGGIIGSAALFQQSPVTCLPEDPRRSSIHCGRRMDTDVLECALVTPPLYSTLTTASATPLSTAPFTPPPELAHLTTPPSPEVPFAQVLVPPSDIKGSLSAQVHGHFGLRSPPPSNLEFMHQLYSCSPVGRLLTSRNSNIFVSECEDTPFIGFGVATSATVSDKPNSEQVFQPNTSCLQSQSAEIQLTNAAQLLKDEDMSIDNNIFVCRDQQDDGGDKRECCPRCGELSVKCKDLSEALKQTREKLTMIERRVDSIDERERQFKQLVQWMQQGEMIKKPSILELSTEFI